jgi:hypothetical protein
MGYISMTTPLNFKRVGTYSTSFWILTLRRLSLKIWFVLSVGHTDFNFSTIVFQTLSSSLTGFPSSSKLSSDSADSRKGRVFHLFTTKRTSRCSKHGILYLAWTILRKISTI